MRTKTKLKKPSARASSPEAVPEPASMTRTNYFIPPRMKAGLSTLAARRGTTAAELVRKAIGTMLKQNGIVVEA